MALLQSEFITVQEAVESGPPFGTLATVGWQGFQVEPDGVQDFAPAIKKLARSPLSSNLMDEKGDVVDLDAMPKLVHDFNKDLIDRFMESAFRSVTKFPGGTGVGKWVQRPDASGALVTAVTSSQFTVSGGSGALPQNVLVVSRGFANAANNGLFVVQAASTSTAIKVTGTVAEAVAPAGATVEVVGVQGTSADITVGSATTITSTALDFTTLGLTPFAFGWLGGGTAAAPGALGFATAADRGFFQIISVAAHTITVGRTTQAWSADVGTGKTIQIFFGPFWRNVPGLHADYIRRSHSLELVMPNVGAGAVTDYVYVPGAGLGTLELNAALTNKVIATLGFIGFDVLDPNTVRQTGAATALSPISTALFNTVGHEKRIRIYDTTGAQILADFESWKLTINNNIKPYKKQGTQGAADLIFGKFQATLAVDGAATQDDLWKAVRDNRTLQFDVALRNNDMGCVIDLPGITANAAPPKFPANDLATFSPTFSSFRDPTSGFVCGMTEFPFLPPS